MNQKFYKYEAAGNDFVIIDNRLNLFDSKNQKSIRKICDRNHGVGSDGLILLEKHKNYKNSPFLMVTRDLASPRAPQLWQRVCA